MKYGLQDTITSGYVPILRGQTHTEHLLTTRSGANGSTFLWLHVRRLALRYVHLHWRVTYKYALDGLAAVDEADKECVVEIKGVKIS